MCLYLEHHSRTFQKSCDTSYENSSEPVQLSANYYYTRDGRREVNPPTVLADQMAPKSLEAGGEAAAPPAVAPAKGRTPGAFYDYSKAKY